MGLVSGPNGPEAGRAFNARRACTHQSFDPSDPCGLSPSEGVIIKQTRVHVSGWWSRRIRCRSYLARDFAGVAHPALKQAMKTVEKERQPITAQDNTDFGVTMELGQSCNISLSRGQRVEQSKQSAIAERQPGLEQWRRLAAMYDPLAAGRSSGDSRQNLSPTKVTKLEDLSHTLQARENLEQRHQERNGDKLPKDMRPAMLLAKGVDSTATPVPGLRTSVCAYCDGYQQQYLWPCSDGCEI